MNTSRKFVLGGIAIAGALISWSAMANGKENGALHKEFAMMDTNKDGKISKAEHAVGAKAMFDKMDADKDGKVTASEMEATHHAVTGTHAKKTDMSAADKIKAIDSNGDGILTAEEHAAGSDVMFDKMDTDKDGFLSKAEMAAGHASMMKK